MTTGRRRTGAVGVRSGSAILVTVGSVATPAVTPYLHSPWQWAVFGLSAAVGSTGLGLQWLTRSPRLARATCPSGKSPEVG